MSAFQRLKAKLADRPGVTDPGGLAAYIGDRKYSKGVMGKAAAKGVSAASIAKKQK